MKKRIGTKTLPEIELRPKIQRHLLGIGVVLALGIPILLSKDDSEEVRTVAFVFVAGFAMLLIGVAVVRYRTRLLVDAKGIRLHRLLGVEFDLSWDELKGWSLNEVSGMMLKQQHRLPFLVLGRLEGPMVTVMDEEWTPGLEIAAVCIEAHISAREGKRLE